MSITYRPSLTLAEIQFILLEIDWDKGPEYQDDLKRKLEVFTLKAKHGITRPSHVRVGKPSKEAELGFTEDERLETLLEAYQISPTSLSVRQMKLVQHHRYINDMMTPEEEAQYEAAQ